MREINAVLRGLPDGTASASPSRAGGTTSPSAYRRRLDITIAGNAGYFIGGLCDGPDITVEGFVGWSVGREPDVGDGAGARQRLGERRRPPRTAGSS